MNPLADANQEALRPEAIRSVPPFPAIAARLVQLLAKEDVGFKEISDLVATDPVFAAEIIRLTNSAFFGLRSEVTSILQALAILGLHRVSGLALTVALRSYLSNVTTLPALRRCWRHSLACALISEEISRETSLDPGEAYTAGLTHDIGRLALVAKHPHDYVAMLDRAASEGLDLLTCEREQFGIDHAEAGRWLTAEWGLPKVFQDVNAFHHDVPSGGLVDTVRIVHIACSFADLTGFTVVQCPVHDEAETLPAIEQLFACLHDRHRERMMRDVKDLQFRVAVRVNALDPGH